MLKKLTNLKAPVKGNSRGHSHAEMAEILTLSKGIVSQAADRLGLTYHAVYDRIRKSEELQMIVQDQRERQLDLSEQAVYVVRDQKRITPTKLDAAKFHLKTQGKNRGWVEKVGLDIPEGIEIVIGLRNAGTTVGQGERETKAVPAELIEESIED